MHARFMSCDLKDFFLGNSNDRIVLYEDALKILFTRHYITLPD